MDASIKSLHLQSVIRGGNAPLVIGARRALAFLFWVKLGFNSIMAT